MAERFVRGVRTFDQRALEQACRDLWAGIPSDRHPDLLVGIRTGGLRVADTLAEVAGLPVPVLPLTCRRASTARKRASPGGGRWVRRLPRPVRDQLRLAEHRVLTRRLKPSSAGGGGGDPAERATIETWAHDAAPAPRILIVDDAVDRGVTLAAALDLIAGWVPPDATIQTAAITVTTPDPLVMPDHVLLRGWLCRFPWSLDA